MPKTRRWELAYEGIFGENGTRVTAQDLQEVKDTFAGRVPVTPGHNLADYLPAFGFITDLSYNPKTTLLVGEAVELSDLVDEAFEKKMYGNWSIGIRRRASDGKKYLHHVAVLGAQAPAIKDLKDLTGMPFINMADDAGSEERWTFKLSDSKNFKFGIIGDIMRRMRDKVIADKGSDEADKLVNDWEIKALSRPDEEGTDSNSPNGVYAADQHKTTGKEKPPALSGLEIVDGQWDVTEAEKRIFGKYGIEGIKAYSLYRDPEADEKNKTAYKFLVADIADDKPVIIAKALSASLSYLHGARGAKIGDEVKQAVEPKLEKLMEKKKKEEEKNMADEEKMKRLEASFRTGKKEALSKAAAGKVPADKMPLLMQLADTLSLDETIELTDASGSKKATSPLDLLMQIFSEMAMPLTPGAMDMGDVPGAKKTDRVDPNKLMAKM